MIKRDDFTFFHPLRVRWAECDAQGIVFNVNYFLYFDVGITEYFRAMGFQGENMLEFYTVHAEADYKGSAVFDDMIDVGVRCARIGNTSMTYEMGIFRDGDVLTEGQLAYVHAEKGTKNASPVPQGFIDRILAFEKIAPQTRTMA